MSILEEIRTETDILMIPRSIHINRGCMLDCYLFQTFAGEKDNVYTYDFDVYLEKYGINLQRPYVWESYQQNEFIRSILLEKPIDPVIAIHYCKDYSKRDEIIYHIIDGKQRLMTVKKFINNEFPIKVNGKSVYFKDFDVKTTMFFISRVNSLTGDIYYSYPDNFVTDDMKIVLFNFYNFSGTPQTEEHKNKLQSLIKNNQQ